MNIKYQKLLAALGATLFLSACGGGGGGGGSGDSFTLKARATSPNSITLSWSKPGGGVSFSPYRVYVIDGDYAGYIGSTEERTFIVTYLLPGTRNCFQIRPPILAVPRSNIACATTQEDSTPPSTPGNLTATAVSPARIDLSWTPSSDAHSGVERYNISRDGEYYTFRSGNLINSLSDSELWPATTYCYQVSAVDLAELESTPSNEVCATTPEDTQSPSVPPNIQGVFDDENSQFLNRLTWEASTDNGRVASYLIFRDGIQINELTDLSALSYEDSEVEPRTEYCYRVVAVDAGGNTSTDTGEICVITMDTQPPTTPQNFTVQFINESGTPLISLDWQASQDNKAVDRYQIIKDGVHIGDSAQLTYDDAAVFANERYCYQVQAVDTNENISDLSNEVCVLSGWHLTRLETQSIRSMAAAIDNTNTVHVAYKLNNNEGFSLNYIEYQPGQEATPELIDQSCNCTSLLKHQVAMAVSPANEVYVMHEHLSSLSNSEITILEKEVDSSWSPELLLSGELPDSIDIAADSLGYFHACITSGNEFYYATNRTGNWVLKDISPYSVGNQASFCSLAIDQNSFIHISYLNGDFSRADDLNLLYITNKTGSWVSETVDMHDGTKDFGEYSTAIATDSIGNVYITYMHDVDHIDLELATNASGAWVVTTLDSEGETGLDSTIAVDSGNNLHIVYRDKTSSVWRYASNQSGIWEIMDLATFGDDIASIGDMSPSLNLDVMDNLHIFYQDENNGLSYITNGDGG